jgi:hypothetical protein
VGLGPQADGRTDGKAIPRDVFVPALPLRS